MFTAAKTNLIVENVQNNLDKIMKSAVSPIVTKLDSFCIWKVI